MQLRKTKNKKQYALKVTKIFWKRKPKKVKALYGNTLNILFDNAVNLSSYAATPVAA